MSMTNNEKEKYSAIKLCYLCNEKFNREKGFFY